MKRTQFNEPRPENAEEVNDVLEDLGLLPGEVSARIEDEDEFDPEGGNDDGINMTGSVAYVVDEDGEEILTTNGFQKRTDLEALLQEVGIKIAD